VKKTDQLRLDFHKSLFDRICDENSLREAFHDVKRNKGASGVDNVSVEEFECNLKEELSRLRQEVTSWTYKVQPVKRIEIPKANGGIRLLGIPTVRDRVLQTSIKNALEPIIDPTFSENSYGFRPGRSQKQALEKAQSIVQGGKEYVVDMDLSKFFDRINHDRLISRLRLLINDTKVLRIIGMTLRCGVMVDGKYTATPVGSVQGSPLSPLPSNVVLDELDKELEKRGLEFCRFADDCNIFVRSDKAAQRVKENISKFIEKKLKLVVNEEKTKVARSRYVKFLGVTILTVGLCISAASMSKAMEKVKELSPRGTHLQVEKSIERFNRWYRGWATYFEVTRFPSQFRKIEAHFRRRIRAQMINDHKRRRFICRKLKKRGVRKRTAEKTAYSNNRAWAMSKMPAAHIAWPNSYFAQMGMYTHSDKELKHWDKPNTLPVLT
jgi:group II intron reverse transcriptase/maturase